MDEIKLKDIFIGKVDGLTESKRKDFTDLFYNGNNNYTQLINDESKFIISGRKGTGKTILAKYYEKEMTKTGMLVDFVNGNDILFSHIKEIGCEEIEEKSVASFIKYTILFEIAKVIVDNKNRIVKESSLISKRATKKVLSHLENMVNNRRYYTNYSVQDFSKEVSTEDGNELEFQDKEKRFLAKRLKNRTKTLKENYLKSEYYTLIDVLELRIFYLLTVVPVSLVFDDIDEYTEKLQNNQSFNMFFIKFIESVKEINQDFVQKGCKGCKIIILLRSDIISYLNSSNLNKTVMDSQILLNWISDIDEECPEKCMLMDLILTKIKNSHVSLRNKTTKEIYNQFFPPKVKGYNTIKYIMNGSHGRPRDVIALLNIIKRDNQDADSFTEKMFIKAEKEYSNYFKDELKNEMALYYENNNITACFRIVTLLSKSTFKKMQVDDIIESCREQVIPINNSKEFLDMMYSVGAIGNYWKEKGKKKYSFNYREDGSDFPDYRAIFCVHIGLRKSLLKS